MTATNTTPGPLLLIGGAEDKVGSRTILSRFVQLAGGSAACIAVIATASDFHDLVGRRYVGLFGALGAGEVLLLELHDRRLARQVEPLEQLDAATAIFITGGDQLKLTAMLGGTAVAQRIRERHAAGVLVGGTSAGASAVAEHMLAYGQSGIPPRKAMMQFAPGLGLVGGLVIDQHFGARGRAGRLMTAVAHNPDLLGIGLDEDTAIEISGEGMLTVLGRGSVMVVDGTELTYSDIHRIPENAPLTIFGIRLHVLTSGYHFDIAARIPALPTVLPPIFPDTQGVGGEGI
jgi:cyanophycinase